MSTSFIFASGATAAAISTILIGTDVVIHPIGSELDSIAGEHDIDSTTVTTKSLEFREHKFPIGVVYSVNNPGEHYEKLGYLGYVLQFGSQKSNSSLDFDVKLKEKY